MPLCSKCRKRKAKRRCPALGSNLCPLCCGLLREKKLHCPSDCPHLAKHKTYQEDRILQKKKTDYGNVLDDERTNRFTLYAEAPLAEIGEKDPSFTDRDAVLALEYARDKIEKGTGRILLAGAPEAPRNEIGEAVLESVEACRYKRLIVLPENLENYTREEKLQLLDTVILNVKAAAGGSIEGRRYVNHLVGQFSKIKELARQQKITPSA